MAEQAGDAFVDHLIRAEAEKFQVTRVERSITFTMPEDKARSLRAILDHIGGCPNGSRRKHIDELKQALDDLDVGYQSEWIAGGDFINGFLS